MVAGLAGLCAVMGMMGAATASAAEGDDSASEVPEVVRTWFSFQAAGIAQAVLGDDAAVLGDDDGLTGRGAVTVGEPASLYRWNETAIDSDDRIAIEDLVEPAGQWIASLYRDGVVVGTITASMDDNGTIVMEGASDDKSAGEALESEDFAYVVDDPQLGGVIALEEDGSAVGISSVAAQVFDEVESTSELRETIVDEREEDSTQPDEAGAGGTAAAQGNGLGEGTALYVGGALVAVILCAVGVYLLLPKRLSSSKLR